MRVLLIILFALTACQPSSDHDLDAAVLKHHCEMVALWTNSAGEMGWPDYNNRAHLCLQEKSNDYQR
jgi:hypothetical protein